MNGLAQCLVAQEELEEAIEVWERSYKLSPGPNAAALGLAQAYMELGEPAKAIPFYKVLSEADPQNQSYKQALKAARSEISDKEEAPSAAEK